jgi:hypothetical protein
MKVNTMARQSTKQPAPKPTAKGTANDNANPAAPVGTQPGEKPAPIVPVSKLNVFERAAADISRAVLDKMAVMGTIRQQLAEANDYFRQGEGKSAEGQRVADTAAFKLYQARTTGVITSEEVSASLGDAFGFKMKDGPNGTKVPGKTPDKQGEAIRKRVVRAVAAAEYVTNGEGGTFFQGLPEDDIASVVAALEADQMSIWTAYEAFAEIKREHQTRTDIAFDYKKIAAITETLSKDGSANVVLNSPLLIEAYGALVKILTVIGETPVTEEAGEE